MHREEKRGSGQGMGLHLEASMSQIVQWGPLGTARLPGKRCASRVPSRAAGHGCVPGLGGCPWVAVETTEGKRWAKILQFCMALDEDQHQNSALSF